MPSCKFTPWSRPARPLIAITSLVAGLFVTGCTTNAYCKAPQAYENAPSIVPIKAPDGLNIASPSTALKVPDVKVDSVTFGYYIPDPAAPGKARLRCLDQPPVLVMAPEVTPPAP